MISAVDLKNTQSEISDKELEGVAGGWVSNAYTNYCDPTLDCCPA